MVSSNPLSYNSQFLCASPKILDIWSLSPVFLPGGAMHIPARLEAPLFLLRYETQFLAAHAKELNELLAQIGTRECLSLLPPAYRLGITANDFNHVRLSPVAQYAFAAHTL